MKPVAWDLFCGRGGWTKGLLKHGFDVVGVDIEPQPDYPSEAYFAQSDIRAFNLSHWPFKLRRPSVIVASPPCVGLTRLRHLNPTLRDTRPRALDLQLVAETCRVIEKASERNGKPPIWAIENVDGAIPWFNAMGLPLAKKAAPYYLFGSFPDFDLPSGPTKRKMGAVGISQTGTPRVKSRVKAAVSAEIPELVADRFAAACAAALRAVSA